MLIPHRYRGARGRSPCRNTVSDMVTFDDVVAVIAELPDVAETQRYGSRAWSVGNKTVAWERPFSKADVRRFGDATPPDGPILAVTVGDLGEKEAILAEHKRGVFTIPHFDGYAAVLLQLNVVSKRTARDLVIDAWLACVPKSRGEEFLARASRRPRSRRD